MILLPHTRAAYLNMHVLGVQGEPHHHPTSLDCGLKAKGWEGGVCQEVGTGEDRDDLVVLSSDLFVPLSDC